jgi:hypothetical protein
VARATRPLRQAATGGLAQARYPVPIGSVVEVVFACAVVAAAFGFALTGLLRGVFLLSPTAYVGLVPVVALGLMIARAQAPRYEPAIRDRYVDYALGLPLLASSLVLLLLFPAHASPRFWQERLDLLSLPLFAAGAIATIFGIRALWRVRGGIAILFVCMLVPLTTSIETLLSPMGAANSNGVVIGSKAALGSLIVGLALMNLAYGRFLLKVLWVATGLGLAWVLATAGGWVVLIDRPGAVDNASLQRLVELAMVILSVFVMVSVMPLFGLRFIPMGEKAGLASVVRGWPRPVKSRHRPPYAAMSIVALAAVLAFIGESSLPRYSAVLTDTGAPRLTTGLIGRLAIPGWSLRPIGPLPWVGRYYGPIATGERYGLDCACTNAAGPVSSSPPVMVDDIVTPQDLPLSAPQLALVHPVRGAQLINLARVDLGDGVIGHAAVYRQSSGSDWIAIYWDWPVVTASGTGYEHLIVQASGSLPDALRSSAALPGPMQQVAMSISDWLDGAPSQPIDASAADLRSDLAAVAHKTITNISAGVRATEAGA